MTSYLWMQTGPTPTAVTVPPILDLAAVLVGGLSGALLAERKGFDIVGVVALAIAAALGGGILRDILLQQGPPVALQDPRYLLTALGAAAIGFLAPAKVRGMQRALSVVDALNLGVFAVVGALKALLAGLSPVASIFLGVVTAVGGGVTRDLLAGDAPAIFHRGELYAVVAALGSALYVGLWHLEIARPASALIAIIAIFVLRLLAAELGWEAPRPRGSRSVPP